MSLLQDIKQAVIDMDKEKSAKLVNQALDKGSDAEEILNEAF